MALWVCGGEGGCGTKYAVGLSRCPRCHNTEFFEDGDPMAKISRHGGASDDTLPVAEPETDDSPEPKLDDEPTVDPLDVTESLAGSAGPAPEEGGDESDSSPSLQDPGTPLGQDYETWTVEQLKEQLDRRGLPKTGKKDDLVLRLLEDDDTRTTAPEDTE